MSSQRSDSTVRGLVEETERLRALIDQGVPSEVPAQLELNQQILAMAEEYNRQLPELIREQIEDIPPAVAQQQMLLALAFMPSESRRRIARCVDWLADVVEVISWLRVDQLPGPGDGVLRLPARLRLLPAPIPASWVAGAG